MYFMNLSGTLHGEESGSTVTHLWGTSNFAAEFGEIYVYNVNANITYLITVLVDEVHDVRIDVVPWCVYPNPGLNPEINIWLCRVKN